MKHVNIDLDTVVSKIENVIRLRSCGWSNQKDVVALEEYMGVSIEELKGNLKFYKQLKQRYIKLPKFKFEYNQIKEAYDTATFEPTGQNDYRDVQGYAKVPYPEFVKDQFTVPIYKSTGFLRALPNKKVPAHTDMGRVCAILIPFIGEQNKNPLRFWKYDEKAEKDILISETYIDSPILIDTTVLHSVDDSSDVERINFTICFDYPFSFEVVAGLMLKQGVINA
jgi:hypothetical protein